MEKNAKGKVDMCLAIKEMMEDSRMEGKNEGMEQGLEAGRVKEAKEIAGRMLAKGFSMSDITEIVGYDVSALEG